MFDILLESHPARLRAWPGWGAGAALLLHAAAAGALLQTPAPPEALPPVIVPLPLPSDPDAVTGRARRRTMVIDPTPVGPLPRLLPVPAPELPDLGGLIAGRAARRGGVTAEMHALMTGGWPGGGAVPVALTQEPPALLSAPPPVYPPALRDAGIEGTVMVRLVVDTLGRPEPGTLRVLHSDHPGLVAPAIRSLRMARFRPARMSGRAVRVLVEVPVRFRLRR